MSTSLSYGRFGPTARDRAVALFGQTMAYVAATAGLFALGAYLGRHLTSGWAIVGFIAAFACLIGMNFTVRLRRATELDSAPLIAASIFLDVLNVFLFFVRIFSKNN